MPLTPDTAAAVQTFRDLGWDTITPAEVLTAPLGTPAQQKVAKKGLSKGPWDKYVVGQVKQRDLTGVDHGPLTLFAIRQGVPAARAAELLRGTWASIELVAEVIASRGETYVAQFIKNRWAQQAKGFYLVQLLGTVGGTIPDQRDFLDRWATIVRNTVVPNPSDYPDGRLPTEDAVRARFVETATIALTGGRPADEDQLAAFLLAVEAGWMPVEDARELALNAMETGRRPVDRKTWADVLLGPLGVDDDWLRRHRAPVLSALSHGDDALINLFTVPLLGAGDDEITTQVLLTGLGATSAKARVGVLEAIVAAPPLSEQVRSVLGDSVALLTNDKNKKVATLATKVAAAWQVAPAPAPVEEPTEVRGLWQPTPPLAEVPRFSLGPATEENLTTLVTQVRAQAYSDAIPESERLLAAVNRLRPENQSWTEAVVALERARKVGLFALDADGHDLAVGDLPAILSTPSFEDFRIDPADLADRLDAYVTADSAASEENLQLAMFRMDRTLLTDEVRARLESSAALLATREGTIDVTAGQVLTAWLSAPFDHPGFDDLNREQPAPDHPVFELIPRRFEFGSALRKLKITTFATWSDAAPPFRDPRLLLLRPEPLGADPASYLLAFDPADWSPGFEPALTAWRNGVLQPGVVRARHLTAKGSLTALAARAAAWEELAQDGMLSLVWPLLADAVAFSAHQPRILPGTDEAIEVLRRLLPEVELAVATGLATDDALELAGVRAIAAKAGKSNAVVAAKTLVALLPETPGPSTRGSGATAPETSEPGHATDQGTGMSDEAFAQAWGDMTDHPVIDDGAALEWVFDERGRRDAEFTLSDGSTHRYGRAWGEAISRYGRAQVSRDGYLTYDPSARQLVLSSGSEGESGPAYGSSSMARLLLFNAHQVAFSNALAEAVANGMVGPSRVAEAIDDLLALDDFDPYKLAKRWVKDPAPLPGVYPVLTRAIRHGATSGPKPPPWLLKVVDVATMYAPLLREAAARGRMLPEEATWAGLREISETTSSAALKRKSKALLATLGL